MISWRTVLVWAIGLALIALTARLGFWQMDRAAQKTGLHEAVLKQKQLPVIDFIEFVATKIKSLPPDWRADLHRPIAVQGRWLAEQTVFLDNRQMNGRPGFFVITPLVLDGVRSPSGKPVAWLVQRGWVARDFLQRDRVPRVPTEPGSVTVSARIAPPPARLLDLGGAGQNPDSTSSNAIRQNLDIGLVASALNGFATVQGSSLLQIAPPVGESQVNDGLLREWAEPAAGVTKHHGYAAQWFGLSGLLAVLLLWFQVIAPRRKKSVAPPAPIASA